MNTLTSMLPRGVGTMHARTTGTTTTPTTPTTPIPTPPRPPTIAPAEAGDSGHRPEGRRRATMIALAAVAVLGILGSVVGVVRTERRDDQLAELRAANEQVLAQIESADAAMTAAEASLELVTNERDDLATRLGTLTVTLRDRANDVDELRDDLTILTTERDALASRVDELTVTLRDRATEVATLRDDLTTLTTERDDLSAANAELETTLVEKDAEIDELASDIATLTDRLVAVTAERNALIARFPIEVRPVTNVADVVGTYDVALTEVYCSGTVDCGTLPDLDGMEIRRTTGDNLQVVVPGVMTAGLYRTNGALFAIADTTTAVPACSGTARTARVAMTIHPSVLRVERNGTVRVAELAASLVIETDAVPGPDGCAAGLVVYGAELTPQS